MTKEEALRVANEIAHRVLGFGENAARAADGAEAARVEAKHADAMTKERDAQKRRAKRLATAITQVREILGAKDGESVQEAARRVVDNSRDPGWIKGLLDILKPREGEALLDAARRCAQAVRPWRPISELVKDGRRVEVWHCKYGLFGICDTDVVNPAYTHFREIDPTKPEGV